LALVSTAILVEGFDISRADAYTRQTPKGTYEAVDLFWVRRPATDRITQLSPDELSKLRGALNDMSSSGSVSTRLQQALPGVSPGTSETRVQFKQSRGTRWTTLELQSNDRPGLLAVVSSALALEGVQILDSRIRTHGLRVHDYFDVVDADGSRLTGTRLHRLQLAVIAAVDGPGPGIAAGIGGSFPRDTEPKRS
jgi:UTP:GlnB (protein PII) uridylyltransferase